MISATAEERCNHPTFPPRGTGGSQPKVAALAFPERGGAMQKKSPKRSSRKSAPKVAVTRGDPPQDFVVAAIGASAGGLEASTELIQALRDDTGMAFVLIQHLDPKHHSILAELLSKKTKMPVDEARDKMRVEPNHVYVIPPDKSMYISDHVLRLGPRQITHGVHMPIDQFMRSLAEAHGSSSVGVILSGTGSDGTLGLREIQAQGGVTMVQDEVTAKYEGMPRSAIATGCVDLILPPEGIAEELRRISHHPYATPPRESGKEGPVLPEGAGFQIIFQLLRRSAGVDFTHYRQTTVRRRIQRRMVVHKIDKLDDYVRFLQANPAEIKALYQDMLINVTSFFRNPKVFDALKTRVFPTIVKNRQSDAAIRIWTVGCASGEETYSVAMMLLEYLGDRAPEIPIQFFGTDVSEPSIVKARNGWYPENIQADVSPERLRRFFAKTEGGFRISKTIRDLCIFAHHNVLSDPPFSQMDLVCCRNLLIYLEPVLQTRLISMFHYATKPTGFLVLGASEGVGAASQLFSPEDRNLRIFSRKATASRPPVRFSMTPERIIGDHAPARAPIRPPENNWNYAEAQKEFDRRLLTMHAPPTAFVTEDYEVIHTRGNVNPYLKLAPGRPSLNILKMAREGLLMELRNALSKAKKENATVRKTHVHVKNGSGNGAKPGPAQKESDRLVDFEVIPIRVGNVKELYFMIIFRESPVLPLKAGRAKLSKETESSARRITELEEELAATKEYLQSVIETQEATNEELQSANEEVLSSNEELQSTNEELETAKEELQSANEELSTVNDELRDRNEEVTSANRDMSHLFSTIGIAILIVGDDLKIRRFTPEAQRILGLIPGDVGRPLANINPSLDIPNLQRMIHEVIGSGEKTDTEAADKHGVRYLAHLYPYQVAEHKIEGAVMTLIPVAAASKAQ
jgi:two-component system, chemotaxis family, CheB/CheR fusion protein